MISIFLEIEEKKKCGKDNTKQTQLAFFCRWPQVKEKIRNSRKLHTNGENMVCGKFPAYLSSFTKEIVNPFHAIGL